MRVTPHRGNFLLIYFPSGDCVLQSLLGPFYAGFVLIFLSPRIAPTHPMSL